MDQVGDILVGRCDTSADYGTYIIDGNQDHVAHALKSNQIPLTDKILDIASDMRRYFRVTI